MKKEFDIEDIWIPHEIHPEIPIEGQSVTDRFSRFDVDQIVATCRQRGEPYGLEFGELDMLSNTRLALEAAEFARGKGAYHVMHNELFKRYFRDGQNLGDRQVVLTAAERCGLDVDELKAALDTGVFADQVKQGSVEAKRLGVTAIPAFFIEGLPPITGAVSEDRFREALASLREK